MLAAAPAFGQAVAVAGGDVSLECGGEDTRVTVSGNGSTSGEGVVYSWTAPGVSVDAAEARSTTGEFYTAETIVTLTVPVTHTIWGEVTEASDSQVVDVSDPPPLTLYAMASPGVLWPPNHKLHSMDADVYVEDVCDSDPEVVLYSLESNEPDNGRDDGNTGNDIQGAPLDSDDSSFLIRAEGQGAGSGRVYTAAYGAIDASGNTTYGTTQIRTPHDTGHYKKAMKDDHRAIKAAKKAAKAAKKAEKAAAKAAKKAVKASAK
jgi:hypothetical protein